MKNGKKSTDMRVFYEISTLGRLKSIRRNIIMNPSVNSRGYLVTALSIDGVRKVVTIHRLVLETFKPNPDKTLIINHIDEDKTNNNLKNLEWCTYAENSNHGNAQRNRIKSYQRPVVCLENNIVYNSILDASKALNLKATSICRVLKNKRKSTGGYHFEYTDGANERTI